MKKFIIVTPEGNTIAPNKEILVNNMQVLGIVENVNNENEAVVKLLKENDWINVAFSRARNLLIIVGNPDNFRFGNNEKSAQQYDEIFNIAKKFGSVKGE
jgi:hypothetical protein